jgi:hypothetical protein
MPPPPGTMVNTMLDRIVQLFNDPANRERIQSQCIDPFLKYILNRMFPYIIMTCVIFSCILLFSLISVILLVLHFYTPITPTTTIIPSEHASVAISALAESVINATS